MQDRFKFRLYDDIHREMIDLQEQDVNPYNISDIPQNNLMQCTGLKDKNGKLIFEGDIVNVCHVSQIGNKEYCIAVVEYKYGTYWASCKYGAAALNCDNMTYEVIGNIYENPELLERQHD